MRRGLRRPTVAQTDRRERRRKGAAASATRLGVTPRLPTDLLRPCLLLLLAEEPSHGYELADRLEAFGLPRNPGGMYRRLRQLEEDGLVRSAWEPAAAGPARRRYTLRGAGQAALDTEALALAEGRDAVDRFLSRHRGRRQEFELGA